MRAARFLLVTVLLLAVVSPAFTQNLVVSGGFEEGNYGWQHWWPYSPWNTFTVLQDEFTGEMVYYHRDGNTGPSGLPRENGVPGVEWIAGWTPSTTTTSNEYKMTPFVDYSAGYENPGYTGFHWLKKNPSPAGAPWYSGADQLITGLTPGQKYVVNAWGFSGAATDAGAADMRILVSPNGGTDARTAPISSARLANHANGRYWLWGRNAVGTWDDTSAADVTGFYALYDNVNVEFTATGSSASVFLLMDWRTYDSNNDNGIGIAWDGVSVTAVPEPSSLVALGSPVLLAGLALIRRRRS